MRSANSTTERCARSPNVTMRERSAMLISDLMRATEVASAGNAGRFVVSLTGALLLAPPGNFPAVQRGSAQQIDDILMNAGRRESYPMSTAAADGLFVLIS